MVPTVRRVRHDTVKLGQFSRFYALVKILTSIIHGAEAEPAKLPNDGTVAIVWVVDLQLPSLLSQQRRQAIQEWGEVRVGRLGRLAVVRFVRQERVRGAGGGGGKGGGGGG